MTELLEYNLRRGWLTNNQIKLLDEIRTEYERRLDLLENNCTCMKRK